MEETCDKLFIFSRGVCFLYSSKRVFLHRGDNDCNDYPVLSAYTFLPVFYNCVSLVRRFLSISPSFIIHPLIHTPYLLHRFSRAGWLDWWAVWVGLGLLVSQSRFHLPGKWHARDVGQRTSSGNKEDYGSTVGCGGTGSDEANLIGTVYHQAHKTQTQAWRWEGEQRPQIWSEVDPNTLSVLAGLPGMSSAAVTFLAWKESFFTARISFTD